MAHLHSQSLKRTSELRARPPLDINGRAQRVAAGEAVSVPHRATVTRPHVLARLTYSLGIETKIELIELARTSLKSGRAAQAALHRD